MPYLAGQYDVAVIGAGHAGIEAALASARMGLKTIIFAILQDILSNFLVYKKRKRSIKYTS